MLVLVTNREDLTADWMVLELERRGKRFIRVCSEDYPTAIGIELTPTGGALDLGAECVTTAEISSVWWRRPLAPVIPQRPRPEEAAWAAGEAQAAWEGYWGNVDAHWVNRPAANLLAECKPVQLKEAYRLGLTVPPTLITNKLAAARAFCELHGGIVCKALRSGVLRDGDVERLLYTQRLDPQVLDRVDELGPEPYLFQAFIDKVADVRVTVIGDRVFACRIESQVAEETAVDWRRGPAQDLHHEEIHLGKDIAQRVRELAAAFGLRFAAIDLAIDHEGRYVFFEVNPNGQWAWIEHLTGQPLAAALADELSVKDA